MQPVGDLVGERHLDVDEAGTLEPGDHLRQRQGPGDAADPAAALGPLRLRETSSATTSLKPTRPPGLQDAGDLGEHPGLVGRQVDDAVRDHDVDRLGGQRHLLDLAAQEVRVRDAGLGLVVLGEREHLVGHVEAVDDSGRPDATGREQHVDAAAGAEVEHRLALAELCDGGRVAAAEACSRRRARECCALLRVVQRLAEQRALALRRAARAAAAAAGRTSETARAASA